jgi:catechol 2,3-dioxygenase-like lactoylglutathione lyase family enzyme
VWDGPEDALHRRLADAGAAIEEGPVERHGGRRATGTSVYVRDPDGNLLEIMIYRDDSAATGAERSVESTHEHG